MTDWLKVQEACDLLGISPNTLRRLVREGRLQAYVISAVRGYQFRRQDVEKLIIPVRPEQAEDLQEE
jgi:excisionase family DNA binding protein